MRRRQPVERRTLTKHLCVRRCPRKNNVLNKLTFQLFRSPSFKAIFCCCLLNVYSNRTYTQQVILNKTETLYTVPIQSRLISTAPSTSKLLAIQVGQMFSYLLHTRTVALSIHIFLLTLQLFLTLNCKNRHRILLFKA